MLFFIVVVYVSVGYCFIFDGIDWYVVEDVFNEVGSVVLFGLFMYDVCDVLIVLYL